MPRTLTAGKSERPSSSRFLPDQYQEEVIACIFSAVATLFMIGRRRPQLVQTIAERDLKLSAQYFWTIRHPDHPDIESRRQRVADGEIRLCGLRGDLNAIDGEAESLRRSIAKHLDRLKPRRRAELLAEEGWPLPSYSAGQIAERLWRDAQEGKPMVGGEARF